MTTPRYAWIASALWLALAATIACNRTEAVGETLSLPETPKPAVWRDAQITAKVQARYFADDVVEGFNIDVATDHGVVTLSGTVQTDAERAQAVRVAQGVEGVTRVENQLRVDPTSGPIDDPARQKQMARDRPTDDSSASWLKTKIQAQYFGEPELRSTPVDVDSTSTGVVTLRGTVPTDEIRRHAANIARSTSGVRQVIDELHVSSAESSTDASDTGRAAAGAQARPDLGDPWITALVQSKYFIDDEVKGAKIDVSTENGLVTLTGVVATPSERRQAVALARSTQGVKDVRDRLTISGTSSDRAARVLTRAARDVAVPVPDSWITTKIQSKYYLEPNVRNGRVEVTTKSGVVTIRGDVQSESARRTAEEIAREVEGVKRVVNELEIEAPPSTE